MALLAAWLTVRQIAIQIRQAEEFHRDELRRRQNAARSVLPLALANLGGFFQNCADVIAAEVESRGFGENVNWNAELVPEGSAKALPALPFPESAISAFSPFIETLSDSRDIRHVAELISSVQILNSRFVSLNLHQPGTIINLYGLLIDVAKARMLAGEIFNYSRFLDEGPFGLVGVASFADVWDKIGVQAHGLLFSRKWIDGFWREIDPRIARYKANGYSPWNEKPGE